MGRSARGGKELKRGVAARDAGAAQVAADLPSPIARRSGRPGAKPAKQGRHRTSRKHTPGQVLSDLQQQADSAPESFIYARVLQLPLVQPSASGTESA